MQQSRKIDLKFIFFILVFYVWLKQTNCSDEVIKWNIDWANGCSFYGNDLYQIETEGSRCGLICSNTPACTHFTWAHGVCWLKQGRVAKSHARRADNHHYCGLSYFGLKWHICGFNENHIDLKDENFVFEVCDLTKIKWIESENLAYGCEFDDDENNFHAEKVNSYECTNLCDMYRDCSHFTFKNETCWLKSGFVTKNEAKEYQDFSMLCGIARSKFKRTENCLVSETTQAGVQCNLDEIIWMEGDWSKGCEFNGNDIESVNSEEYECKGLCDLNRHCTHYYWTNGICQLKGL